MKNFLPYSRLGLFVLLTGLYFLFLPMPASAFQATVQQAGAKDCEEKAWYPDSDEDGFGAEGSAPLKACEQPGGYTYNDFDCDDNNAAVNPLANEILRDGLDNDCDGITDDNPNSPGAPMFEQQEVYLDAYIGETSTFTIKALDPQIGDQLTLSFDSAIVSGQEHQVFYGHMDGVTFSPPLPLTSQDSAVTVMRWEVQEDQLAIVEMYFSAKDQHGNKSLPLVINSWTDYRLVTHPLPPLAIGVNQPFEAYITTEHNQELNEDAWLDNAPEWLQAKVVQVPDPSYLNMIRIWGTPPAGSEGTYTPKLNFRELFGQEGELEFQLTVSDCQNSTWYADRDGDGFGAASAAACEQPAGFIATDGDCDDEEASVNPSAPEILGDELDNDCDGRVDVFPGTPRLAISNTFFDIVEGEAISIDLLATDPDAGDRVSLRLDSVYNWSQEVIFHDFAGVSFSPALPYTATDTVKASMHYVAQQEHYGDNIIFFSATDQDGNTSGGTLYARVHPILKLKPLPPIMIGAESPFEAIVQIVDAEFHFSVQAWLENAPAWLQVERKYDPQVSEGYYLRLWGTPPAGSWGIYKPIVHVSSYLSEEQTQYHSLPLQIRVGNCFGYTWYADADGDGFGAAENRIMVTACYQPAGFVSTTGDCNDEDPSLYPGATELVDGLDNNCNGEVDEAGSCYASQVVSFRQGYRPDGKPIGWERSRPAFALNAPQENDYFNFISLGFGGELVLELGSLVYDDGTEAPDMMVVETTWGWSWRHCYEGELSGNPETMVMEVSANGTDWVNVSGSFCRNAKVDLSPVVGEGKLPYVRFVKITDTSNPADFPGHANGYDVDGIITCPELFEERQTNARIAGAYDPNFFNKAQEEEEVLQQVKFYPNPVKNKLTIQTGTTGKLEVKVYSLQGSLVYTGQHQAAAASGEIKLNLGTLAGGVYLIHLQGPQLQEFFKITKD